MNAATNSNSPQPQKIQWGSKWLVLLRWFFLFSLLMATALAAFGAMWQVWYSGRIFPGVALAGVPLSGLSPSSALALLQEHGVRSSEKPILVTHKESIWVLPNGPRESVSDLALLVNRAYNLGRSGDLTENLSVRWQLLSKGHNIAPETRLGAVEIDNFVNEVAMDVARAPRAAVTIGNAQLSAQPGSITNTEALRRQIGQAILQATPSPTLALETFQYMPEPEIYQPDLIFQRPLIVASADLDFQFALDARSLAAASLDKESHQYDLTSLRNQVQSWSKVVNKEPQNARLYFNPDVNELETLQPSQNGVSLNVDGTVEGILNALQGGGTSASLQLNWLPPEFTEEDLPSLGITALLAHSETYFRGSSAARVHNIDLTTQQFASILIPPGEVFSFNDTIGPITVAAGYADAAIIWGDRTAIGVGGGVCQVSTTIFRTAFDAGLPIEERHNHGYVVSWYGQPGMDATIYTPYVDLRFRNDTAGHLLLQPDLDVETGTLAVNLFGTPTGRTVRISDPIISQVKEPADPVYREDRTLEPGQVKLLESEKLGLTVIVDRHITENGNTRTERFVSVYQPWQAVYLQGPAADAESDSRLITDLLP